MRKIQLLTVLLAIAVGSTVPAAEFSARPPRHCRINTAQTLVLAQNGVARCEIVVPPGSVPTVKYAAGELAAILGKIIGSPIPVIAAPTPGRVAILLGDNALTRGLGVKVDAMVRDGYVIKTFGTDKLVIAGRDDPRCDPAIPRTSAFADQNERATLFGVYGFLKQFAGVGFYFPGELGTVSPKNPNLTISGIDLEDRPDAMVRFSNAYGTLDGKSLDGYNVRAQNYRYRLQTKYLPCSHGLSRLKFPERFGATHPEYFALAPNGRRENGLKTYQLCWTSNVVEEIYQDAKAYLSGASPVFIRGTQFRWDQHCTPGFFDVMPHDGMMLCGCENCVKIQKSGPDEYSKLIWKYTTAWAKRLKQEGVPGYLTQMSYGNHRTLPEETLPDNVLVMVATRGPWYYAPGFDLSEEVAWFQALNRQIDRKVWLWSYTLKYGARRIPGVPHSTPRILGRHFKALAPYSFGAFLENSTDVHMFQFLHNYLLAEMMWDQSRDPDELLDRAYRDMFGAGAPAMDEFFRKIEALWLGKVMGKRKMGPLGPEFEIPAATELWNKCYSQATLAELDAMLRKAAVAARGDADAVARIDYMRKNFYDELVTAREKFITGQNAVSDFKTFVPELPTPPVWDGKLDDATWQNASVLFMKALGKDAIEVGTRVLLGRDDAGLYIGVDCEEPQMAMDKAEKRKNGDDSIWQDSSVEIFLAPQDRQHYYQLIVNSLGSFCSYRATRIGNASKVVADGSWLDGAEIRSARRDNGWSLEIRIPWAGLGTISAEGIAANFVRSRYGTRKNPAVVYYTWSPFVGNFADTLGFGTLIFKPVANGNIYKNSDFSAPAKGRWFGLWGTSDAAVAGDRPAVTLDDRIFLFGGRSLKITNPDGRQSIAVTQQQPLKPNTRYRASVWIRTENIKPTERYGGVLVQCYVDKNQMFPTGAIRQNIPWTHYSYEFTTPAKLGPVQYMSLYNYKITGSAWFDGAEIVELKSPAAH